jgi:hypothetical protein
MLSLMVSHSIGVAKWLVPGNQEPVSSQGVTPMSTRLESMSGGARFFTGTTPAPQMRRCWGKSVARFLLYSLVACFAAALLGCGESSPPQTKEEAKEKQKVVQEKMKEFMQQKAKAPGARR